ncbi:MAG: alkylation response protein AidB-like acyl-CoA dehydrogenase [Candidatus Azotimanducaceae bacterium]|jgi:alkylation response protein AidB-like acyl-CoA dehydrogenase
MQIELRKSDEQFRNEVVMFIKANLDEKVAEKVKLGYPLSKEEVNAWTSILNDNGWAAPHWPIEVGGCGWTMIQRHVFDIEMRRAHAPTLQGFGFNMVGPAIAKYGTANQKETYLPRILNATDSWCQGYSEPQAGSDLASLKTQAVVEGDDYIINGSKIWTSAAEQADMIFVLVKTDVQVKPQLGISFLLIDMNSLGITVQPLLAFNGKRLWNQVFFDDVRVPRSNCLGGENKGWSVAKNLLGNERLMVSRVAENRRLLGRLTEILQEEGHEDHAASSLTSQKLAMLDIRLQALDATAVRLLSEFDAGGTIGAEPSMLKLKGSQLVQDIDCLLMETVGYYGLPLDSIMRQDMPIGADYADMIASGLFHHRGFTIAGGSSEVQHNIIAKQVLGL